VECEAVADPNGRPKSESVRLTKAARERFDRQLAEKLSDIFTALFDAGTKDKDTQALSLLVSRAVPVRKGVPVNFRTRPLSNPTECAAAFGDILEAISKGELTPDEGNMIGALIDPCPSCPRRSAAPASSTPSNCRTRSPP